MGHIFKRHIITRISARDFRARSTATRPVGREAAAAVPNPKPTVLYRTGNRPPTRSSPPCRPRIFNNNMFIKNPAESGINSEPRLRRQPSPLRDNSQSGIALTTSQLPNEFTRWMVYAAFLEGILEGSNPPLGKKQGGRYTPPSSRHSRRPRQFLTYSRLGRKETAWEESPLPTGKPRRRVRPVETSPIMHALHQACITRTRRK